jgi:GTP-binding protein HflX
VIDASDDERDTKVEQVDEVLHEIGAEKVPQIAIYNKIDCLDGITPHIERDAQGKVVRVYLSAKSGEGMALLAQVLGEWLSVKRRHYSLQLPPSAARLRARLYELGAVVSERVSEDGMYELDISIEPHYIESLRKQGEFSALLPPA